MPIFDTRGRTYLTGEQPHQELAQEIGANPLHWAGRQGKGGVDRMIYGTKIVPLFKLKTATTTATISAGTIFKSFMETRYKIADIVAVQNCTVLTVAGSGT